ncbi:AMP-binding protein [Subtercola frigoramans]|uniref:O-succinylbenzoic acid--CoA ligase n=1 Tax=Subtercola frigoramans TaxID=120298 RepID=A0ABS2L1M1_9MICO|nr:AMP-binding protein [Subtercola frigoramans]MBM7470983.1 O-succinylbenzoic acid--CoA ligase [Subtercola frigoramans]
MTRRLEVIGGGDPAAVTVSIKAALDGSGPAILPRERRTDAVVPGRRVGSLGAIDVAGGSGGLGEGVQFGESAAAGDPPDARPAGATQPSHAGLADARPAVGTRTTPTGVPRVVVEETGRPLPGEVPKRVALVIETSGTSGVPKRVALSADALLASAAATESALGGEGQWVLALPTHYIAGMQVLVRSIVAGTQPIVMPAGHFTAEVFASLVDELTAPLKFTSIVPAQLVRLVEAAEAQPGIRDSLRRLDALLIGGQAVPQALFTRALALGLRAVRTYGSSETSGGCVYDGRPIGQAVARVTAGELELGGPTLAEGYLGDEELTQQKFYSDAGHRWYRTADGGDITDGIVSVTGRLDNVMISGGIKVSLDRVERAVQSIPGYATAIVAAVPSEAWGQAAVVVVALPSAGRDSRARDDSLVTLQAAVTASVGRAAAPTRVVFIDTLPTLSSGKPDRLAVARMLAERSAE